MDDHPAFFILEPDGAALRPQAAAVSGWNAGHVRGPAVAGALARAAEAAVADRTDLRPARASIELFRPTKMEPAGIRTTLVRSGRRLALVDCFLEQGGDVRARASVLFLSPGPVPASAPWQPEERFEPPPADAELDSEGRVYRNGEGAWTPKIAGMGPGRKQVWQTPVPIVAGETPSPFQSACAASDLASLVIHLAPGGLSYINADVTLHLARLPLPGGIGLAAGQQAADHGISTGVAVLFDRSGTIGSATVSALANAEQPIAPRGTKRK